MARTCLESAKRRILRARTALWSLAGAEMRLLAHSWALSYHPSVWPVWSEAGAFSHLHSGFGLLSSVRFAPGIYRGTWLHVGESLDEDAVLTTSALDF